MAATAGAGPRAKRARSDREMSGNLRPLAGQQATAALGEWIELLARISHDLRTPLNAVIGFSDAMQNELFGPLGDQRYQEYARYIRDSGDRLLSAAEQTLAMTSLLAAPRDVTITDVRLDAVVREAAAGLEGQALAGGVGLELDLDRELMVLADGPSLTRAMHHLLTACLAAARPGDDVLVSTRSAHGRITLHMQVATQADATEQAGEDYSHSAPDCGAPRRHAPTTREIGLGRDALTVWLARVLLETQSCDLHTDSRDGGMVLSVGLEEAAQHDFFAHDRAWAS